jgi:hypothetical protein
VDENERRAAAGRPEEDAMTVQHDLVQLVVRGGGQRAALADAETKCR